MIGKTANSMGLNGNMTKSIDIMARKTGYLAYVGGVSYWHRSSTQALKRVHALSNYHCHATSLVIDLKNDTYVWKPLSLFGE